MEEEEKPKRKGIFSLGRKPREDTEERKERRDRRERMEVRERRRPEKVERVNINTGSHPGVIAVTGDRNTGVTSTAAFIAETYADMGIPTLLLDLDFERKGLSLLYREFPEAEKYFTNTQLGTYTVLNNPDMIEDVQVAVKDNLHLISMSREDEFKMRTFADKNMEDIINTSRITTLLGVAKGIFGVVIVDMPFKQVLKYPDTSLLIDKYVFCTENTLYSLGNLFGNLLDDLADVNEVVASSVLDKMNLVLTRYSVNSRYGRSVIDERFTQDLVRDNIHGRVKVAGRISHTEVFYNQIEKNARVIDLKQETRNEVAEIVSVLNTY